MGVHRPDELYKIGLMVEVRRDQFEPIEQALLVPGEEAEHIRAALGCVTLNFRGTSQYGCNEIGTDVKRVKQMLPEALIAGIGLDGSPQAEKFGNSEGSFYTYSCLETKGTLRGAWPLPWADSPIGEGIGCHRLYPMCGIDMLQAVTNWSADFGRNFIACFRGEDQFAHLWGDQLEEDLARAGAVAIEVRLADVEAYASSRTAIGEPRSAFGKLALLRDRFLENRQD